MLKKEIIHKIIRVNHAGEYGAKRIYEGQIAFTKDPNEKAKIQEMLDGEKEHLDFFNKEIAKENIRPTILFPIWHISGYALGAVTAIMGKKSAMACTYAVEEIIEDHYQKQINQLKNSKDKEQINLCKKIKKFQEDEMHHQDIALKNEALKAPFYKIMANIIAKSSKTAIWLSERF